MATTMASDMDEPDDRPQLFVDAELVIYWTEIDDTEFGDEAAVGDTDLAGVSLWARYEDEGREVPLFSCYPNGGWLSLSVDVSGDIDHAEPVSEAFVDVNGHPWEITEEVWEDMPDRERVISHSLRWSVLKGNPIPEQVGVWEWCRERSDFEPPDD